MPSRHQPTLPANFPVVNVAEKTESSDRDAAGFQIFNPGSPTDRRRQPRHTMGVAEADGGAVHFELVTLD